MNYKPKQGDIIWLNLDEQVGVEQSGHRPVIVVSNEEFHRRIANLIMICPITSTDRNFPTHVKLDNTNKTTGVVKCEQAKILDFKCRDAKFIEVAPVEILEEVKDIVMGFIE